MQISRFSNNISSDDTHSNEYAAGTVSDQSFTERKQIENNRKTVGAYQFSQIGQNFLPRGEYVRPKPRQLRVAERKSSRQEMNANGGIVPERPTGGPTTRQQMNAGFHEPPARSYNPYA